MALLRTLGTIATDWAVFLLAAGWLALFSQTDMAARWHGQLFPVVTELQITDIEPYTVRGAPGSRIKGTAIIRRDECDYLNVTWQLNGANKSVSVPAFFADPAEVRKNGVQEWHALLVGVEPDRIIETTGNVHHQCGMFPVTTPFFRPDSSIVPTMAGATAECQSGAYSTSTGPGTCSGHGGVREWLSGS